MTNGRIRFGAKEWLGLAGIMLTTVLAGSALQHYLVQLEIRAALLEHITQGPHQNVATSLTLLSSRIDQNTVILRDNAEVLKTLHLRIDRLERDGRLP